MSQFLLSVSLFLMFFPACFAILFASRRPLLVLWNLAWFYLMGQAAEAVFSSPDGRWLGLGFSILYIFRMFQSPLGRLNVFVPGQRSDPADFNQTKTVEAEFHVRS